MVINMFLRGVAATKQHLHLRQVQVSRRNHEIASLSARNDMKQTTTSRALRAHSG